MGKYKKRGKHPLGWKKVPLKELQQKFKSCKNKEEKALIGRKIQHIKDWMKANLSVTTYYPDRHK